MHHSKVNISITINCAIQQWRHGTAVLDLSAHTLAATLGADVCPIDARRTEFLANDDLPRLALDIDRHRGLAFTMPVAYLAQVAHSRSAALCKRFLRSNRHAV